MAELLHMPTLGYVSGAYINLPGNQTAVLRGTAEAEFVHYQMSTDAGESPSPSFGIPP